MSPQHWNPLALSSALLAAAPVVLAQFKNDFKLYPAGTQGCLDDAAARSQCTGNDAKTMNSCLCANGGNFVTNSAICIGREVPDALRTTWNNMSVACQDSGVQIAVSDEDFIRTGEAEKGTPSTRTMTSTGAGPSTAPAPSPTIPTASAEPTAEATATVTASQAPPPPSSSGVDDEDEDAPPPSNMTIAVMAGIAVAGAVTSALAGCLLFIIWRRRRARKLADARAPFYHLPDDSANGSRNPALREWKPTTTMPAADQQQHHRGAYGPPPSSSGGLSVPGAGLTGLGVSSVVSPVTATATSPYPPSTSWTANSSPQGTGWGSNHYHSPTWTSSPVFPQQPGTVAELPSDRQAAHELDSIEVPRPPVEMPAPYDRHTESGPVWADIPPTKR